MKKTTFSRLSERYLAALRIHFEQGPKMDLDAAHKLGARAAALGLETADLARMHGHALMTLILPDCSSAARYEMATHAAIFFSEASAPVETKHRFAPKWGTDLEKLKSALARYTRDLGDSKRALQEETSRREAAGEAVRASGEASAKLLGESRRLQAHLQDIAHRLLNAHEDERRAMSLNLQDEIAQTLHGIQIRLFTLRKEVSNSDRGFKKEIAITQRLVGKSVRTINRFVSEFGRPHEN